MDFYYGRCSGNSARVAFALYEAGVPFRPRLVDTQKGENTGGDYLALNPMGKIPALVDGGGGVGAEVRLWESNAINWYIAETFPQAGLLPTSPSARAGVQKWLFFQVGHVTPACGPVFLATNARMKEFWRRPVDAQAVAVGRKELARFLPVLEEALGQREWLEHTFSLADIAYAPHLSLIADGGFDLSGTPALRAWLDRILARPAWKKTIDLIFAT